ncbi:MAG: KamA family radical SAM protein [Candidatus Woesearchaeota archaeon]
MIKNSKELAEALSPRIYLSTARQAEIDKVRIRFPMRISSYYASLIKEEDDPIWKQSVPKLEEILIDGNLDPDPLSEEKQSPVPFLVHRYPDRVLLYVSNTCAVYCRHCTRKRKVGDDRKNPKIEDLKDAFEYIATSKYNQTPIRSVILSGGDPLLLNHYMLDEIIGKLKEIPNVESLRIGTRVPVTDPERITAHLTNLLKKYDVAWVNTHYNHPREITPESIEAIRKLRSAGVSIGNQCVLLRGVNDSPETMMSLFTGLEKIGVRPYYMYQADLAKGTAHFWTSVDTALEIMQKLIGNVSGLAVPHYVIDSPGGGGKIRVLPDSVRFEDEMAVLRTFQGKEVRYPRDPLNYYIINNNG